MDIQEFLLARIAEDEAVARAAAQALQGAGPNWANTFKQVEGSGHQPVADAMSSWYADHIARNDPARVLAECAAKRAIIGMHRNSPNPYGDQYCATCAEVGQDGMDFPCETVKVLAAVYSDHPDYQQKWSL